MSKPTKWTPGPWRRGIGDQYHRIFDAQGRTITDWAGTNDGNLIAAAPELYEALQAASDMLFARPDMVAKLHPLMGPAEHAVCDAAAKALAKARGE